MNMWIEKYLEKINSGRNYITDLIIISARTINEYGDVIYKYLVKEARTWNTFEAKHSS